MRRRKMNLTNQEIKKIIKLIDDEIEIYEKLPKKILEGSLTAIHLQDLKRIKKNLKEVVSESQGV